MNMFPSFRRKPEPSVFAFGSRKRRKSMDSRFRGNDGNYFLCAMFLLLFFATSAFAQPATADAPLQFRDATEESRFHALTGELRCVMCQNQSLADSNAMVAHDLRREVLELMRQGKSDREIKDYLVARYGEFVLYRPRVEANTWLLWFGPALVLLAGAVVVVGIVRRRSRGAAPGERVPDDNVPYDDRQEW